MSLCQLISSAGRIVVLALALFAGLAAVGYAMGGLVWGIALAGLFLLVLPGVNWWVISNAGDELKLTSQFQAVKWLLAFALLAAAGTLKWLII
jgi:hypothetical protein